MTSATKRDDKKQTDHNPTDLNAEPYKTQNQKHHRSRPEHVSLLSRYSLQTFSFTKVCGLCNVAQLGHTFRSGLCGADIVNCAEWVYAALSDKAEQD